jgi:hypothetical protein
VVAAALINIVLLVMGIAMGISGLHATRDLAGPAAAPPPVDTRTSSEDPPPLTPVLDPAPKEPRPVEQIASAAPAVPALATTTAVASALLASGACPTASSPCPPARDQGL